MFSTNLIVLGTFSFISVVAIIIQAGWKFTHILVPKLPKNKRWSDILITSCQLSVAVFIFYTVNIWFWTDSSEDSSDIWKMSNPVELLKWKVSNASEYFSTTTNILSFDEAVDALPEEAEEVKNVVNALRNFRGPEMLAEFNNVMQSSQCNATLRADGQSMYTYVSSSKEYQTIFENNPLWPRLRQFMKHGMTHREPFMKKRELIEQYLESVSESMMIVAEKLKKKEQELTRKMVETTNHKNRELLFVYVLPSMVVFIWTILSILTTRFNPKLRSFLVPRTILNSLFYIVAVHVVIVFIYELVSSSNQCQPDPQLLDFSEFEIPAFNKSSRTVTKEDFLNCTASKSHIFAAPNDEIFIPTTTYDDYLKWIPDTIRQEACGPISLLTDTIDVFPRDRQLVIDLVPKILAHTTTCAPLRDFKPVIEGIVKLYDPLIESAQPFDYDRSSPRGPGFFDRVFNEKSLFFINKGIPNMRNVIVASIRNYNDVINATGFDCSSISDAFQHGFNRTCYVINHQLISIAKLVLIGISVIAIITHILANRKYENELEKSNNQQEENQSNA